MKLNAEQERALKAIKSGANVFLTGKAGTGKSTVISAFRDKADGDVAFVAPTGVAAVNIKGATIHSFFQIKPGVFSDIEPMKSAKKARLLRQLKTIVIDEISMVRSDLLEAVDLRMREVAIGANHSKPFGGCQLVVVGDFYQLPPVVQGKELEYINLRYGGPFAFQSKAWNAAGFKIIELTHVHRQSDADFLVILNAIRVGDASVLDRLNPCVADKDTAITLTPYKAVSEAKNMLALKDIKLPAKTYTGRLEGKFVKDLPVAESLTLKLGARVMTRANVYASDGSLLFCNGDLGNITAMDDDRVVVRFDSGKEHTVHRYEWQSYDFDLSGSKVVATPVGSYTQLPLQLAWAVTIHKSQGCTFDSCTLELDRGCFAEGQLYTALSRVRSLQGLCLSRAVTKSDVKVASEVLSFMH